MAMIGVIGSGMVGETLAGGLLKLGYEVMLSSRTPSKLQEWSARAGEGAHVGSYQEAAAWAEMLIFAVKGVAALDVLDQCGLDNVGDKIIVDATNPISPIAPKDGVLSFFTDPNTSLMEQLQTRAPRARFVKAFSCVGADLMVQPKLEGGPPSMFICGDDGGAKGQVSELLQRFGWEVEDMGGVIAARAIEPLCILWCIPGFRGQGWSHAFKLLR